MLQDNDWWYYLGLADIPPDMELDGSLAGARPCPPNYPFDSAVFKRERVDGKVEQVVTLQTSEGQWLIVKPAE